MKLELVAGNDGLAEPRIVDGHEIDQLAQGFLASVSTTRTAAVCAIASTISTPGMTGRTGK